MTQIGEREKVIERAIFEDLSPQDQQQYFNDHGFVLLPGVVSAEKQARIEAELESMEIPRRWDYVDLWPGSELESLISNPKLLGPLRRCFGDDIRFFKSVYTEWRDRKASELEYGRQPLHRDYTPESDNDDYRNSCAAWVNVGHYFIDLDVGEGPLWVVPGSHKLAWTGQRDGFVEQDDNARMVLARAGDAVMFRNLTLHGGGAMNSGRPRPSVFQSYRAGWAAPLGPVPEWPKEVVERAAPELRRLLEGQNDGERVDVHGIVQA